MADLKYKDNQTIEIAVIGAGIIGMACAYRLQTELRGVQVSESTSD